MEKLKQLIGQDWVPSASGETQDDVNPATEAVIVTVPRSGAEDVDRAVRAASEAFREAWSRIAPAERGRLMNKLADLVERDSEPIGRMDSEDMGKPLADAIACVGGAVADLRYYAGLTDKIEGKLLHSDEGYFSYTLREPYGVVAAIIPWNFPINQITVKVAPALAAGNAVILKPSEVSPRSALHFGALALEAGLPPGTLNVLTGRGGELGTALVQHTGIGRLTFTGSCETGRRIVQGSASNFKKLTLELGGKSANIIMPDANMEAAVSWATRTAFLNSGQICTTGSRLLLHKDIKKDFLAALIARTKKIVVGDPADSRTRLGPICSKEQYVKVCRYIEIAKKEKLDFLLGEENPATDRFKKGYYLVPTILDDVSRTSVVACEEIFGPVLSVFTFSSEDEAIEIANDTQTGLAADLWSTDLATVHRMAARIESGIVWVNCSNVVNAWMPYGGQKQSGSGFESGPENILEFTKLKTVVSNLTGQPVDWPM